MKRFVVTCMLIVFFPAMLFAAPAAGRGRSSMAQQMSAGGRIGVSGAYIGSGMPVTNKNETNDVVQQDVPVQEVVEIKQEVVVESSFEKAKQDCLAKNNGFGNTYVWASRYSVGGDYSTMVEDVNMPENNACYVRVELQSDEPKVNVSDVPVKYFEYGSEVLCGEWADKAVLKDRILEAEKTSRVWATVGASVGGAGLGVLAMETFGNKWIGGAVEGQENKKLTEAELIVSQVKALKGSDDQSYNSFIQALRDLKSACSNIGVAINNDESLKSKCAQYEYVWGKLI